MEFTAHNILLDNGETTMKDELLLSEVEQLKAALRTLNAHYGDKDKSKVRVADLGCLEGGYSVEFARKGYQALGIEVREVNIEKCRYVAEHIDLPNLEFVKDDVLNVEKHGKFNTIFCCGLLYHLDNPFAYLKTLSSITKDMLILQTHYSTDEKNSAVKHHKLSKVTTHEGLKGRWYNEYDPKATKEEVEHAVWASYENNKSFWPDKRHLMQAMKESGFDIVYEQFDFLGDISKNTYVEDNNRSLFIGIKSNTDWTGILE